MSRRSFNATLALVLACSFEVAGATCAQPRFHGFSSAGTPLPARSDPILAANQDGHLEAFVLGSDGAVWHSWEDSQGTWSAWVAFPNPPGQGFRSLLTANGLESDKSLPQLAAAQDAAGRLQLFIANGDAVWAVGQVQKNVNWYAWQRLPLASLRGPVGVWAARNADGHVELFVFDQFNFRLVHFWQFNNLAHWYGPAEFDLPASAGALAENLSIGADAQGRLAVAVAGADGNAYVRRQQVPSSGWGGWEPLGQPGGQPLQAGTAWLASNADGRLELMAARQAGLAFWHTWEASAGQWAGTWADFGAFAPVPGFDSGLVQGKGGCLTALAAVQVANGSADRTISATQQVPSSGWNGWSASLAGNFQRVTGHMAVARNARGNIVIMMRALNGGVLRETSSD